MGKEQAKTVTLILLIVITKKMNVMVNLHLTVIVVYVTQLIEIGLYTLQRNTSRARIIKASRRAITAKVDIMLYSDFRCSDFS